MQEKLCFYSHGLHFYCNFKQQYTPQKAFLPHYSPFICPLSPLEAHWNLIGTSLYLYRETTLISSTFHLPFSYKKRTFFKVRSFIHTKQTPTISSPPHHFPRLNRIFI